MSFGGLAQFATQMMRANRAELQKRKSRNRDQVKKMHEDSLGRTELQFKQVSPAELRKIKRGIREKAEVNQNLELLQNRILGVLILIILVRIALAVWG
jgi:hypothetical protein